MTMGANVHGGGAASELRTATSAETRWTRPSEVAVPRSIEEAIEVAGGPEVTPTKWPSAMILLPVPISAVGPDSFKGLAEAERGLQPEWPGSDPRCRGAGQSLYLLPLLGPQSRSIHFAPPLGALTSPTLFHHQSIRTSAPQPSILDEAASNKQSPPAHPSLLGPSLLGVCVCQLYQFLRPPRTRTFPSTSDANLLHLVVTD
jgi:hypothetical protein